ncbi:CBU_1863 family Dot/Icm T4SS effector [Coxiella burnetii]|uniref:CBU_1863 family Dot/Icm T4SS effector n=1 Tax=Coxiella burnetii TaxID=777 RepID=UPI000C04D530|nr:CBU_1863 family Dot/Icm T4SS effector [Coxiella burnetii]ATN75139.1 hypothetical protein AYM90_09295 [Coxiella burnetii]
MRNDDDTHSTLTSSSEQVSESKIVPKDSQKPSDPNVHQNGTDVTDSAKQNASLKEVTVVTLPPDLKALEGDTHPTPMPSSREVLFNPNVHKNGTPLTHSVDPNGLSNDDEVTIVALESESKALEKELKKKGINYFKIGKTIANVAYTASLCLVFYKLSAPRGVADGVISALVNAPSAAIFFDQFFGKVLINYNPKRVTKTHFALSLTGLAAGNIAAIAGEQIAEDAVKGSSAWIFYGGLGVSLIYTFTSRTLGLPGAVGYLLNPLLGRCRPFPELEQFRKDLEKNYLNPAVQRINEKTPERFIEVFYDTIKENPNKWAGYDIYKNTIEKAFQVGGLIAVQHFFGLFQQLAAEGWGKISPQLENNCGLNSISAATTAFFYYLLVLKLPPTFRKSLEQIWILGVHNSRTLPAKIIKTALLLATLGGAGVAAYFSGSGMAEETARYDQLAQNGTLPFCVNNPPLSPWEGIDGNVNELWMTIVAGVGCNFTGMLFLFNPILDFFIKKSHENPWCIQSMLAVLESAPILNSNQLEKELGSWIPLIQGKRPTAIQAIENKRSLVKIAENTNLPRPKFWFCGDLWKCSSNDENTRLLSETEDPVPSALTA